MLPDFQELAKPADKASGYLRNYLATQEVDPNTRFMFMSTSADRPPGMGAQEVIPDGRISEFCELSAMPDWRRQLSNFMRAPFKLGIPGVSADQWETVEHYFQAYKMSLVSPDVAASFALAPSPGDEPDHLAGLAARRRRKALVLDPDTLAQWDRVKWHVMAIALAAKFRTHDDLASTLLATRDAHLIHAPGRSRRHGGSDRRGRLVDHSQWGLMSVRRELQSGLN